VVVVADDDDVLGLPRGVGAMRDGGSAKGASPARDDSSTVLERSRRRLRVPRDFVDDAPRENESDAINNTTSTIVQQQQQWQW
jgi:hypothetical protein